MKHPSITDCDLCKNVIPRGVKYAAITIPLAKTDRAEIRETIVSDIQAMPSPASTFGPFTPENMVPEYWQFDVCIECIEGILPMLASLKTTQIRRLLKEKAAVRERTKRQEETEDK